MSFLTEGFNRIPHRKNSLKMLQDNLNIRYWKWFLMLYCALWLFDSRGTSWIYLCCLGYDVLLNPSIYASFQLQKKFSYISLNIFFPTVSEFSSIRTDYKFLQLIGSILTLIISSKCLILFNFLISNSFLCNFCWCTFWPDFPFLFHEVEAEV